MAASSRSGDVDAAPSAARMRRWLHREWVRHWTSGVLSLVVVAALLFAAAVVTSGDSMRVVTPVLTAALCLAAYGPIFLVLTSVTFRRLRGDALRSRVARTTERSWFVRTLLFGGPKTWASTVAVLGVVSVVLLATGGSTSIVVAVGCVLAVIGTWVLLVAVFAAEHMREWATHDSMAFPGDASQLAFRDFVYLSVQLSTTFATSDVEMTTSSARTIATVHSIVAFAFSTVIVAVFASLIVSAAA